MIITRSFVRCDWCDNTAPPSTRHFRYENVNDVEGMALKLAKWKGFRYVKGKKKELICPNCQVGIEDQLLPSPEKYCPKSKRKKWRPEPVTPENTLIEEQENCILNAVSGCYYIVKSGELGAIIQDSECVDAGTPLATEGYDMEGRFRWQKPDIGPLEYSGDLVMKSIYGFQITTDLLADPDIPNDSIRL